MDFTQKLRLKGKAEEDMYFTRIDRELIEAMHNNPNWQDEHSRPHPEDEAKLVDTLNK